jgi:hypothetical protein
VISDLDLTADVAWADKGVPPGGDDSLLTSGILTATDTVANRVRVSVAGGDPQWMPGLPGCYALNQTVWVLRNPVTARLEMCLGPTLGYPSVVTATLTSLGATRMTVTWNGTAYVSLPFLAGSYTAGAQVWVQLDPSRFGVPQFVLGAAPDPPPVVAQPAPSYPPSRPATLTATAVIFPEWSGTWRATSSAWNAWNVAANGVDTLWQGNGFGSGALTGLATYGSRVSDLGATSISQILVTLRGADVDATSYPSVTVQGSPNGSMPAAAPTTSGDTASGTPGRTGVVQVALTAPMCEALRTGSARGLALVGASYAAVRGAGSPDGMALQITYTRPL